MFSRLLNVFKTSKNMFTTCWRRLWKKFLKYHTGIVSTEQIFFCYIFLRPTTISRG